MMNRGQVSQDCVVGLPASVVWDVYRGLQLGKLVDELLPHVIGRVEVVEGDGGVGTILKVTFPQGTPGASSYLKEIFTKVDDEKRVKETEQIEGGFMELGFHLYRIRLEILDEEEEEESTTGSSSSRCIIRSTIEYEVDEEHAEMANSLVSTRPLETIAQVIGNYLLDQNHRN